MARVSKKDTEQIEEIANDKPITNKKQQALELAIASIEKQFGKGSIMTLEGYKDAEPVKHISSGSIALDMILGRGGFCFGRIVEAFGPEGVGKTSLFLSTIAAAQKLGLMCAIIDKENMLDVDYASKLGVDVSKLYISQPNTGEEALSITEQLVNSGAVDVIVIDSIAAINPSADLEKDLSENAKMAGRASLLTRFFERNDSSINKNKVLVLCTNQLRENLNPYGGGPQTPGGRAMKHAASVRLQLGIVEKITGTDGQVIGNRVKVKTVKNKLNSPYKETTYDLIFGVGIDKVKDLVDIGVDSGILEKAGSWYVYKDQRFQGMNGARQFFDTDEKLEELKTSIFTKLNLDFGPEGK